MNLKAYTFKIGPPVVSVVIPAFNAEKWIAENKDASDGVMRWVKEGRDAIKRALKAQAAN